MNKEELFCTLKQKLKEIVKRNDLLEQEVSIHCRALSSKEAIGDTKRKDFPILTGKDIMIQAEVGNGIGQAFTSTPSVYHGSLKEVLEFDIVENDYDRGIFIATLNAVMRHLGMCECSVHCKDNGPEECAVQIRDFLKEKYKKGTKIVQVGYQPAILENISKEFEVKILDLNPDNVGQIRYGVKVLDGVKDYDETISWADVVLCTGSTLGNGTIVNFLDLDKDVWFYGTTAAGAAALMGWKRLCFAL